MRMLKRSLITKLNYCIFNADSTSLLIHPTFEVHYVIHGLLEIFKIKKESMMNDILLTSPLDNCTILKKFCKRFTPTSYILKEATLAY